MFSSENDVDPFYNYINYEEKWLQYINEQHPNIKFTVELETDKKLSFLDVLLEHNNKQGFSTCTFYKKTYTGLLTNYHSFTSSCYKFGLIKTLVDRSFKINSSWSGFDRDCNTICKNLQKNCFPKHVIERYINAYVNQKHTDQSEKVESDLELRYFKLPFIGQFSSLAQKKINKIVGKYCNGSTKIKIIFTPFKIGSMFSTKDLIPRSLKSQVVYKFTCPGCNASYIGETNRRFSTRIMEHLSKDKSSHIYKHLSESENCRNVSDDNCFIILDQAQTKYQLKIKEALHIQWQQPSLNKQVVHYNITITA